MRRLAILAVLVLGLLVLGGSQDLSVAQEATPEAVMPVLTGDNRFLTFADFGLVDAATLPAAPVGLTIFQL